MTRSQCVVHTLSGEDNKAERETTKMSTNSCAVRTTELFDFRLSDLRLKRLAGGWALISYRLLKADRGFFGGDVEGRFGKSLGDPLTERDVVGDEMYLRDEA